MSYNWRQVKAIESSNKKLLLKLNDKLNDNSGIYFITREDEIGIKYAYVGQAKHVITRLAQHMVGLKQHIDLSIKKRKLYSSDNIYGWKVDFINCDENELDEKERFYIHKYANEGYQLLNKTSGGQDNGKTQIAEYKPRKGYQDGVTQGYKKASKEIANLFEKHLKYEMKSEKLNKNQEKALKKFEEFLEYYKLQ